MTLTQVLIDEAETTYDVLERLFNRVSDEDLSWAPSEGHDWMAMGQLLMHCATAGCGQAVRGFATGTWPEMPKADDAGVHLPPAMLLPAVDSVGRALELLLEDRRLTLRSIALAGEENLLTRRMSAPWGGRELSLFQQLLGSIKHLAQHKGQLFYYLKLMGRQVDTHDLWGE